MPAEATVHGCWGQCPELLRTARKALVHGVCYFSGTSSSVFFSSSQNSVVHQNDAVCSDSLFHDRFLCRAVTHAEDVQAWL